MENIYFCSPIALDAGGGGNNNNLILPDNNIIARDIIDNMAHQRRMVTLSAVHFVLLVAHKHYYKQKTASRIFPGPDTHLAYSN